MNPISQDELNLAQELKDLCYSNGKEKDPESSGNILCQIGKIYKIKVNEKISLIQSCALFNAALVRSKSKKALVLNELRSLCKTVLKQAKAAKQDADLVEAANVTKNDIFKMRKMATYELSKLENIPSNVHWTIKKQLEIDKVSQIKKIQDDITQQYISIMKKVCDFCFDVMGKPSYVCEFALAGMGSTARKEVTPFSDFEYMIILDDEVKKLSADKYEEVIEHFRWLTVLFQIVLINFGETVLPSVAIPCLNDHLSADGDWFFDAYTICGISCDGMKPHACKIPLGRYYTTEKKNFKTELIKPVSEMLSYLDRDQDIKNGYHLADVLTQTCFVSGNLNLYLKFNEKVVKKLETDKQYSDTKMLKAQIRKDYAQFNVSNSVRLMYSKQFSIKSVIYRSMTIFLSALGRIYCLKDPSCFEIIKSLKQLNVIDDDLRHKLDYAVAIACEVRLKVYMKRQEQDDRSRHRFGRNDEMVVVETVGGKSLVDFFTITKQLQSLVVLFVDDALPPFLKFSEDADYHMICELCYVLDLKDLLLENTKKCLLQMSSLQSYAEEEFFLYTTTLRTLDANKIESKFLSEINEKVKTWKKLDSPASEHKAYMLYKLGFLLENIGKYQESLIHFRNQLQMQIAVSVDPTQDYKVAGSHFHIGYCLKHSGINIESAKQSFKEALCIRTNITSNSQKDFDIAHIKFYLGQCEFQTKNYKQSLNYFEESLMILKKISLDEKNDSMIGQVEEYIKKCFCNLKKCSVVL